MTPTRPTLVLASLGLFPLYLLVYSDITYFVLTLPLYLVSTLTCVIFGFLVFANRLDGNATSRSDHLSRQRHALRPLLFSTRSERAVTQVPILSGDPRSTESRTSLITSMANRLDTFFKLVLRSFILPWYNRISPSSAFPNAVEVVLTHSLTDIVKRAEQVDWSNLVVSRILPLVSAHIHHYRSIEHLSSTTSTALDSTLPLPLPRHAHPALSQQQHVPAGLPSPLIEAHLRESLERMLGEVLPEKEKSEVVLTITREITLGAVFLPAFEMLCDSDFWNRQIEEKGGRYLHEQKQVNKFLSALSSLPHPSSTTTTPVKTKQASRSKNVHTPTSITAASSTRQFDGFIKSIPKLRTLGESRRLRADVEREQRSVRLSISRETMLGGKEVDGRLKSARRYDKRLDRAKVEIDARIAVLTRIQGATPHSSVILPDINLASSINLFMVLSDPSSLAYWLEYMDRRQRSRLVQFWLAVEGFKDPLEIITQDWIHDGPQDSATDSGNGMLPGSSTVFEDVSFLHEAYLASRHDMPQVPTKHREVLSQFAQRGSVPISSDEIRRVRHAMFGAQKAVYEEMEEEDWEEFKKVELFRKVVFDLFRSSQPIPMRPPLPSPRIMSHVGSPATASLFAFSPPPRPVRQMISPAMPTRRTAEPRSPMSPPPRALPILINGNFTPSTTSSSLAAVTTHMPTFERKLTEPIIQSRKVSGTETDLASSTGSLPSTPPMVKRSSQLDFLVSGGEKVEHKEERGRLFDDDADGALNEDDEDDYVQVQRMEAIQAALNDIIASDDMAGNRINPSRHSSGSEPARSLTSSTTLVPQAMEAKPAGMTKGVSRSFEDLRKQLSPRVVTSAPQSRVTSSRPPPGLTHRNSMPKLVERPERPIFSDDVLDEEAPNDVGEDQDGMEHSIQLAAPGNLQLSVEISKLQEKIQDLVKQEHLLDTLTRQAELTGSSSELKILHRSLGSVRREQRTAIFQKAQFEQQEEENRLIPGRTQISVPKSVMTVGEGEGKQVVRYIIEIQQIGEEGKVESGWVVARRYNEFWEMDKALREWVGASGDGRGMAGIVDLPPKKLGINLASSFVESRRTGLERYLQSLVKSTLICDAPPLRSFLSRSQATATTETFDVNPGPASALSSLVPHNIVKSLYKTMATSLDESILSPSMLDLMYTTLNRQLNDISEFVGMSGEEITGLGSAFLPSAIRPAWGRTESAQVEGMMRKETSKGVNGQSGIQPMGGESGTGSFTAPICDLFIEMFDLKENNWLRRQAIVVILQQFLGGTIERKVRDTVRSGMSSESMERVLASLQETLWPGGERMEPSEPRTEEEREATKLSAGRKLGLLIPDVAANMIGRGNARRAARRVFGVLQDKRLNQQLILCILDEILGALFPPNSKRS